MTDGGRPATCRPLTYRAYRLAHEGCTLGGVNVIEAGDDESATEMARTLVDTAGVELWRGKKLVIWMPPTKGVAPS